VPPLLDDYEGQVRAWLDAEPALSAQAILIRLIDAVPGRFNEKHLRTVQRAVRTWRGAIARSLLRDGAAFLVGTSADAASDAAAVPALRTADGPPSAGA
jgi:hypothetical protein